MVASPKRMATELPTTLRCRAPYPAQKGHFLAGEAGRPRCVSFALSAAGPFSWQPGSPVATVRAIVPSGSGAARDSPEIRCAK